jgi:hypothetical protein
MTRLAAVALLAFALPALAADKFPGTEAGAKALIAELAKPGADKAALSKTLRPAPADFEAVFTGDAAKAAAAAYGPLWEKSAVVISGNPQQTVTKVFSATTEELKSGAPASRDFPGGYAKVAGSLKPGLRFYAFKFLEPGKDLGMAFDGLVFVNGHWAIFPKPWKFAK